MSWWHPWFLDIGRAEARAGERQREDGRESLRVGKVGASIPGIPGCSHLFPLILAYSQITPIFLTRVKIPRGFSPIKLNQAFKTGFRSGKFIQGAERRQKAKVRTRKGGGETQAFFSNEPNF